MCGPMIYNKVADHLVAHRQHGETLVAAQRFRDLHLRPSTPVAVASNAPAVPPLRTPRRFHQWVDNLISDRPSRSSDLTDNQLLTYLKKLFPQPLPWQLWTPPPKLTSGIASALRRKTSERDCLLAEPPPPMATGPSGPTSAQGWPSTPY